MTGLKDNSPDKPTVCKYIPIGMYFDNLYHKKRKNSFFKQHKKQTTIRTIQYFTHPQGIKKH